MYFIAIIRVFLCTVLESSMAQTLATLRQEARDLIGDTNSLAYVFTTQQIDSWINAAIRDLNNHFPRTVTNALSTTAGTHIYDLPTTFISMLKVEYPSGDDPPSCLMYRSSRPAAFWDVAGYYDILYPQDLTATNPPQLVISASPARPRSSPTPPRSSTTSSPIPMTRPPSWTVTPT